AVNSKGTTSTKILSFEEGVFEAMCFDELNLPAEGGMVSIIVSTNYEYEVSIPDDAITWLSAETIEVKSVRFENIILTASENTGEARSAVVSLLSGNTVHYSLTITQEAKVVDEDGYEGTIDDWKDDGSLDL
ncbi:MAG: BACON domain-containing protein, partial [Bacteroidales bacterium]|nr:BACON domain-containing protein [Bacteroidales bacterium]